MGHIDEKMVFSISGGSIVDENGDPLMVHGRDDVRYMFRVGHIGYDTIYLTFRKGRPQYINCLV